MNPMAAGVSPNLKAQEQEELLRHCIETNQDLDLMLKELNLNYDSLIYKHPQNENVKSGNNATFELEQAASKSIPYVSFFSGAGGMDLGFESAGFHHAASFEINELFCNTMRDNRPGWQVFGPPFASGDMKNRDETIACLETTLSVNTPFEGVFVGGPPCQPFSIASNQRFAKWGDKFKRTGFAHALNGSLLLDYIYYITAFKPKCFVIENVPGLSTIDGGAQLREAVQCLEKNGYAVSHPALLDAADYGVPQRRRRLFICGWRSMGKALFRFPAPSLKEIPCVSVLDKSVCQQANHITRSHKAESILRYMNLEFGERDHLGRVDRLHPWLVSKTVIAGGVNGGGRSHLHPFIPRTLSVRECARLQTFPDSYKFLGPPARQFTQVGNAVPPKLACKIAVEMADQMAGSY